MAARAEYDAPDRGGGWLGGVLRALLVAVALIAIWQAVILVFAPPPFMLPPPARVWRALVERPDLWQRDAVTTLIETVSGLVTGALAGIALALVMTFVPAIRRILMPLLIVTQAFPVFAIAPLLVLWFGFGIGSKIVMATIAIFFPVASAFHDGLTRTEAGLIDLSRLYRARNWQEILYFRIPYALPALASGLRVAAVYAPVGALIGEWVGASSGLGYAMLMANGRAQTDVVFAALALLAAMAVLVRAAVDIATRHIAPWAPETLS
ncbi:ABC transporter permease [Kaistia sp. 32K]|uniref:ABC transporter permease n=1 Tax=Kaistia sp. 32K TaxID=2795690 RepID=UPI001934E037|nr:ABC transporter permease [Kaistia sp. 32K]BCP54912.1 ABC transporter permease [Kaistia sp. 32K]